MLIEGSLIRLPMPNTPCKWSPSLCLNTKNPPANAGDLGGEDPLEEEMAAHFSVLA